MLNLKEWTTFTIEDSGKAGPQGFNGKYKIFRSFIDDIALYLIPSGNCMNSNCRQLYLWR